MDEYKQTLRVPETLRISDIETSTVLAVPISKLAETGDYNLSADRYRKMPHIQEQKYQMVKIEDIFDVRRGASPRPINKYITEDPHGVNWIKIGDGSPTSMYISSTKEKITQEAAKKLRWVKKGDLILSNSMSVGHPYIMDTEGCIHDGWLALRPKSEELSKEFFYHILGSNQLHEQFKRLATGGVVNNLNSDRVRSVEVPLPPLEIQHQIVNEIVAHQRIIDGARWVVEGWKPNLDLELDRFLKISGIKEWERTTFGNACLMNPKKSEIQDLADNTVVSFVPMEDMNQKMLLFETKKERTKGEVYKGYTYFRNEDVLLAKVTPCFENGKSGIARNLTNGIGFGSSEYYVFRSIGKTIPEYIYYLISDPSFIDEGRKRMTGTGGLQRVPIDFVTNYQIPLPPLEIQHQIVTQIEHERLIVDGNREMIRLYEEKVKRVIERLWEE